MREEFRVEEESSIRLGFIDERCEGTKNALNSGEMSSASEERGTGTTHSADLVILIIRCTRVIGKLSECREFVESSLENVEAICRNCSILHHPFAEK